MSQALHSAGARQLPGASCSERSTRTQGCQQLPQSCLRQDLHAPAGWQCLKQSPHRHQRLGSRLHARRKDSPILSPLIPIGEDGQEGIDMFSYLLRNRIIFVRSRINDEVATQVVASLLALESIDPEEDITIYINSQGGSPYAVIAILDTIAAIKPNVATVAFGLVASTATVLLASGKKGKRTAMPNTRIMMHQPLGGAMGSADEVNIQASELNRTLKVINSFLHRFTGMPMEKIERESDRDNFLSPVVAKEFGLIDSVIGGGLTAETRQKLHAGVALAA